VTAGQWIGVFAGHVWMLSQTSDSVLYKSFCMEHPNGSKQLAANDTISHNRKSISEQYVDGCEEHVDHSKLLQDYFQLSVNLQEMYEDWGQRGHCFSCCGYSDITEFYLTLVYFDFTIGTDSWLMQYFSKLNDLFAPNHICF